MAAIPEDFTDLRKVRVSAGLFEALADRVDWGDPDDDGFYAPSLYRDKWAHVRGIGPSEDDTEEPSGCRP